MQAIQLGAVVLPETRHKSQAISCLRRAVQLLEQLIGLIQPSHLFS
jgi:hypothetical protein